MAPDPPSNNPPKKEEPSTHASIFVRLKDRTSRELAWSEFEGRYAPIIAAFARRFGITAQADVDDVVQSVMLSFYKAHEKFVYDSSTGSFRGYLKTATFNQIKRKLGQSAKLKTIPLEDIDPASPQIEEPWNDIWHRQVLKEALNAAQTKNQDPKTFRAFELNVIFGKTPADVAKELDMTLDSVYQAKTRMLKTLRKTLQKLESEFG